MRRYAAHKNTHIIENKIHVAGGISRARPVAHISRTYATIPKANPSKILKHSATIIMQKNTGMSSAGSENFICDMLPNIKIPITISAGAVAAAGTAFISGERNRAAMKNAPVKRGVSPVRPPDSMPADDSTKAPVVEVPSSAPMMVAEASAVSALPIFGKVPSGRIIPQRLAIATTVAMVSSRSSISSTNITGAAFRKSLNG